MQHKSFDILETKSDAESGTFSATVAVFGNVDRGGDRIMPGAFSKTLAQWEATGDPIPVILSHQWDNPMAHIGVAYAKDMVETDKGLLVKGKLDIEDNEVAAQVHRLMARRSLKEFSFGYSSKGKRAKDGANELTDIELYEIGPTLKGMNPATELHAVKSALDVEEPHLDEADLRKQTQQVERGRIEEQLPDIAPPEPEPEVKPILEPKNIAPPLDAGDLRKQSQRVEAERLKEKTPDVKPPEPDPEPEKKPEPVKLDGEALRKQSSRLERERLEEKTPDIAEPEGEVEKPEDGLLKAMADEIQALKDQVEGMKTAPPAEVGQLRKRTDALERERSEQATEGIEAPAEEVFTLDEAREKLVGEVKEAIVAELKEKMAEREETPSEEELRKASQQIERKQIESQLPEGEVEQRPDLKAQVEDLSKKIELLVAKVDQIEETSKKKAEEADKESIPTRSVDPLRRRSEEIELAVRSGGISERKPPIEEPQPKSDTPSEAALRRKFEEDMLDLLEMSGSSTGSGA